MPESGKEDLSYSHLHQEHQDEKQSYSYCDIGVKVMLSNTILQGTVKYFCSPHVVTKQKDNQKNDQESIMAGPAYSEIIKKVKIKGHSVYYINA